MYHILAVLVVFVINCSPWNICEFFKTVAVEQLRRATFINSCEINDTVRKAILSSFLSKFKLNIFT